MKGYSHERTKCKFCAQDISQNAIERHEKLCAKQTDEERALRTKARGYAVAKRERDRPVAKRPYQRHLNGTGRRLRITVSVDYAAFLQVAGLLRPHVVVDGWEVR